MPGIADYFKCECGCMQSYASEDTRGGITEKEAEQIGWRKINNAWRCPKCCGNTEALDKIFDHAQECECLGCSQGQEAVQKCEQEGIEKVGWYGHMVMSDPDYPHDCNVHTHGIKENFDHLDLQICLPLPQYVLQGVLNTITEKIREGEVFEAGKVYDGLLHKEYPLTFAASTECNRDVLRIIFPDQYKNLDPATMEPDYKKQWDGTF